MDSQAEAYALLAVKVADWRGQAVRLPKLRIIAAALFGLIGTVATTPPSAAQTKKDHGSGGTGGAAGYSPATPDEGAIGAELRRGFTRSLKPPEPMNAPTSDEQKKDKATLPPDDPAKAR